MIYLDNAATSFPKPESVYDAMMKAMKEYGANPGRSGHKMALQAGRAIYETREVLSKLFNIDNPMNIIFTYNATDSLNMGIKGLLKPGDHAITTSIEHNSVLRPLKTLEKAGITTTIIQCDSKGRVSAEDIEKNINDDTKLIITTHISNLTGTINPIKEIGGIAKKYEIIYMVDASQSAGVYEIDVKEMNIDMLAVSGHNGLMGPQGGGVFYIRDGLDVIQIKEGGTGSKSNLLEQPDFLPDKFESGTPNMPGIVGLGVEVKYILEKGMENIRNHKKELTKYFLEELKKIEGVKIYGPCDVEKQAAVVSINIGDEDSSEMSYVLDEAFDIAVRSGLHCAPLAHKTIGTFEQGTIRFSMGAFTTLDEIKKAVDAIKKITEEII